MSVNRNICEQIYLWKECDKDIFIRNELIARHQIEGVRFLFKEFKKKNLGAVLNFPQKSGKSTTFVMFLYAIRQLLEQPVLIICKDEEQMQHWQQTIKKWTEFTDDDVTLEPTNAFIKKKIFIKHINNLLSFCRRSWSIVVIKNDDIVNIPPIPNVNFKLWITSTDLKKDKKLLSYVHKWIFPKENVNFNDFEGDLEKLIIFDTFLQDFVLRINKVNPFEKLQPQIKIVEQSKRKNKDITGAKIKRSKVNNKNEVSKQNVVSSNITNEKADELNDFSKIDENVVIIKSTTTTEIDNEKCNDVVNSHAFERNNSPNLFSTSTMNEIEINTHLQCEREKIDTQNYKSVCRVVQENDLMTKHIEYLDNTNTTDDNKLFYSCDIDSVDILAGNEMQVKSNSFTNLNNDLDILNKKDETDESIIHTKDELASEIINCDGNEVILDKNDISEANGSKLSLDIDSKLNKFEEQAMKKFKGSFLDNLF